MALLRSLGQLPLIKDNAPAASHPGLCSGQCPPPFRSGPPAGPIDQLGGAIRRWPPMGGAPYLVALALLERVASGPCRLPANPSALRLPPRPVPPSRVKPWLWSCCFGSRAARARSGDRRGRQPSAGGDPPRGRAGAPAPAQGCLDDQWRLRCLPGPCIGCRHDRPLSGLQRCGSPATPAHPAHRRQFGDRP